MSGPNRSGGLWVAGAGTGVNLALGVLYAWSVIKSAIPDSWGWSNADKALPYSVACLTFALAMIPAGRLQDKIGPRWVATMGGILAGLGCVIAWLFGSSLSGFVLGFGVLAGTGIGFGYAAATPAAVKWFPPARTGLVAGIVVAGFGLASVYIAPLATWLLNVFATPGPGGTTEKGVSSTMLVLGLGFLVAVTVLSQLLRNPPPDAPSAKSAGAQAAAPAKRDWTVGEMLGGAQFYVLWLMYFAGAAAGLTFISVAQSLGKKSLGDLAFVVVVVLAVGNAGGRILAGMLSDRFGREKTLLGALLLQSGVVMTLFAVRAGGSWPILLVLVFLIGANYGSNLALFPAAAKDYFGLRNFGLNYGILFSAWGAAGLLMPWLNGFIADRTGSDAPTYFIITGMLVLASVLTFVSRSLAQRVSAPVASSVPAPSLAD